ncbi:rhamnulokinase [Enemella evansiae]|uniref:rhamnulokinase n=1 Tax=Enemella evansiae TaxID=2016499 RepID=UPI00105E45D4|nr:rhamnulokinase family protein [Enemella evansiae]TDO91369.1 rhamnulokinase [Enemella evansiae]
MTGPSGAPAGARVFGAIDIGASGGRVMAGVLTAGRPELHTVHRFGNRAVRTPDGLRWDWSRLVAEVEQGLGSLAEAYPQTESIGIDTWAIDYGLLDAEDRLLADPMSYRDDRGPRAVPELDARIDRQQQYAINGLQHLPFTTGYQLAAERSGPLWPRAARIVLLPDLLAHHLTGVLRTEATNASTTGLVDVRTGDWSAEMLAALDIPAGMLPPIDQPGEVRGRLRPELAERWGFDAVVTTVGSHDTASAVVGVPASSRNVAYASSGTWSLVGVELDEPVLTEASRDANFTNERGVDGRIRYLRNVGGLWLLQECLRAWDAEADQAALLAAAAEVAPGGPLIDVDDEEFIAPDGMPERIAAALRRTGAPVPQDRAGLVRCILDSLAAAYANTASRAAELAGRRIEAIHLVGGGSQNELLCRLVAQAAGLPVIAGPVEATALGNVLVQARAHGAAPTTLEELRRRLATSQELRRYCP